MKFTFWHVMFFAWFCNMAMHIGMSDLTVLRFARKSWYAVASAAGMYVGHFMAWLSASMLFALQLAHGGLTTDAAIAAADAAGQLPAPLPGPLAYEACGVAGLLCVIIAGWTTANPTIYRAGLGFPSHHSQSSRFAVTLVTGGTGHGGRLVPRAGDEAVGLRRALRHVADADGGGVFVDFWLARRLGFQDNYAQRRGISFNWAAGLTWFITLAVCAALVQVCRRRDLFRQSAGVVRRRRPVHRFEPRPSTARSFAHSSFLAASEPCESSCKLRPGQPSRQPSSHRSCCWPTF
jgi:purine-cytosine permease-like protein